MRFLKITWSLLLFLLNVFMYFLFIYLFIYSFIFLIFFLIRCLDNVLIVYNKVGF